jgi:hypothetical protein
MHNGVPLSGRRGPRATPDHRRTIPPPRPSRARKRLRTLGRVAGGSCGRRLARAWNRPALGAAVGRGAQVVAAGRAFAAETTGAKAAGAPFAPPICESDDWEDRGRYDDDPVADPPGALAIRGPAGAPVCEGRAGGGVKAAAEGSAVCPGPMPRGWSASRRRLVHDDVRERATIRAEQRISVRLRPVQLVGDRVASHPKRRRRHAEDP